MEIVSFLGVIGDAKNSDYISNYDLEEVNKIPLDSWGISVPSKRPK